MYMCICVHSEAHMPAHRHIGERIHADKHVYTRMYLCTYVCTQTCFVRLIVSFVLLLLSLCCAQVSVHCAALCVVLLTWTLFLWRFNFAAPTRKKTDLNYIHTLACIEIHIAEKNKGEIKCNNTMCDTRSHELGIKTL